MCINYELMNIESQKQHHEESSDKNPFGNEENVIEGAVDFIMSATEESDSTEEGWTEEAGRMGFAEKFLEGFTASDKVKQEILDRVQRLVAEKQEENRERMAGTMGIVGQKGQGKDTTR